MFVTSMLHYCKWYDPAPGFVSIIFAYEGHVGKLVPIRKWLWYPIPALSAGEKCSYETGTLRLFTFSRLDLEQNFSFPDGHGLTGILPDCGGRRLRRRGAARVAFNSTLENHRRQHNNWIMIVGIGTDLVYIPRISQVFERWGDRFTGRIFCEEEMLYCMKHRDPSATLAIRFAAKEACSKALGTGMRDGIVWRQMCVVHEDSGKPVLHLSGAARRRAAAMGALRWHISLTHEYEYAHAIVILED